MVKMSMQQIDQMLASSIEEPPEREFELWQKIGDYRVVGFYFLRPALAWAEREYAGWHYVIEHQRDLREQQSLHGSRLKELLLKSESK